MIRRAQGRRFIILAGMAGLAACAATPESAPATSPGAAGQHPLDGAFISVVGEDGFTRRDEYRAGLRTSTAGGVSENHDVTVQSIGDAQIMVSWFDAEREQSVQIVDVERRTVWTAARGDDQRSQVERNEVRRVGLLDGGDVALPPAGGSQKRPLDPAWADETYLRGRWLEYTYDNGKFFRNEFHGDSRHSKVKRGLLKELVTVRSIGAGKLFVSWLDDRLGHVAQVIDFSRNTVWASVPVGTTPQIWRGHLEGEGRIGAEDEAGQAEEPGAHPEMPEARVIRTELDGVTVHTVVAPEEVLAVTSHVIETSGHLVVIDTQLTTTHSAQLRRLCDALQKPIAKLIVSHGHPDHYFGLVAFSDVEAQALPEVRRDIGRRFKGHQRMHKGMEGPLIPDEIAVPTEDLEPGDLVVDGVLLEIERMRDAEDVEQVIVRLPAQRAIIMQDLVSNGYHVFFGTGPVDGWITRLEQMAIEDWSFVFAGHGPPGDATLMTDTAIYLRRAAEMASTATSQAQLTQSMLAAFPDRKGPFLVEVSSMIIFRDRARSP